MAGVDRGTTNCVKIDCSSKYQQMIGSDRPTNLKGRVVQGVSSLDLVPLGHGNV
jgi:hypothetical protein